MTDARAGRVGERVVVLGGSVAGLCAAAAVAPHFAEVVVLERDDLPADAEHRRGAPQSKHPHFLLNAGRTAIGRLYPGIEEELVGLGAVVRNPAAETAYGEHAGWAPRVTGQMTMLYSSRVLLERGLRDRAKALPNVVFHERAQATGLLTADGGTARGRVTGVTWRDAAGGERELRADLVVDCLGRGSSVGGWLVEAGWAAPRELTLDAKAVYSSRWYTMPEGEQRPGWWWSHLALLPTNQSGPHAVEHDYLCTVFPIEHDARIVFMGSWGHEMPRTVTDFEAAAERTRTPYFSGVMKQLEPTSEVFVTRSTGNRWRRYDEMEHPPTGLVSLGDATCAFNPLYGQGMSAAACSAVILADRLAQTSSVDPAFHRTFSREHRRFLEVPWTLAVARDQGYDHAEGTETAAAWRRRIAMRIAWPALALVSAAGREDPAVEQHFGRVFNLEESLGQMVRNPRFLVGVARFWVRSRLGRTSLPAGYDLLGEPPAMNHDHLVGRS
ncbi:FAD-dependent oxidoreductase [Nocardioides acrostichi]|uniref:FAD-dependent monooxygenase n=1 Tax=Nocardioides acrostichi TaxID=2784339 RepID=A0A930V3D5_9ACTN|nr:FAD-dependent monooxygenase [Nocardioides acrostichi]MBF4162469.1 FAD-dependent monooxygenase [Nocardioides acrostichi]